MLSTIINGLASYTPQQKLLLDELQELQALKEQIYKARGVMELNPDGTIIRINSVLESYSGYSSEELKNLHHRTLLDTADANSAEYQQFWQALNNLELQSGEFRMLNKAREPMLFAGYYTPIKGSHNKLSKVYAFLTDTTDNKTILENFAGQMAAINKIQGVIEFDLKGNILAVNENFANVTGYSQQEIVGNHHSMFVDAATRASAEYKAFWDNLGRGQANSGAFRRIGKNGKEVWLQASYNPIFDARGNAYKVVKYATDITEATIKNADFQGQMTAINKIQGVIEFDLKGNILAVNENFANVTGYSQQEIVGNHHSMFVDAATRASAEYKAFWDNLGRGEADSGVFRRIGKNGNEVWLQASYNPIFDARGNAYKVVKYATDITNQHNEAALQERAVNESKAVIDAAKQNDLSKRIDLNDKSGVVLELCDGINGLLDTMNGVVLQIRDTANDVLLSTREIAAGNTDLSQRTEEQASNLEETSSSMEQMSSIVKQNAENAKQANSMTNQASVVAEKGGKAVQQVVTTMDNISASSKKIVDIISVIDGIAFQTNILALNAAVEAARAGEQGRGFAVVASEVRNLAQRSATAAKEIKGLITESVERVEAGSKQVQFAGETMTQIVESVNVVTNIVNEIATASGEQSAGIDQVNIAITTMDEVVQQNAALVEEAAAAANALEGKVQALSDSVSVFVLQGETTITTNHITRLLAAGEAKALRQEMLPPEIKANQYNKSKPIKTNLRSVVRAEENWEEF